MAGLENLSSEVTVALPVRRHVRRVGTSKKVHYDKIVNGVGFSKCPKCGKYVKAVQGTLGHLCAMALASHQVTLPTVPAGYTKISIIHMACENANPKVPISRLVNSFGGDRVVILPACPSTYPVCVLGTRARYMPAFWATKQGLQCLRDWHFDKVPANVVALVPDEVKQAWDSLRAVLEGHTK